VATIQKLRGADQAIALAVSLKSFEQAFASLRRGGTLVFVALPAENKIELPIVGTRVDLEEVFELQRQPRRA
jgi:alcohol dehydrogenase, propanol-preferring